MGLNLNSSAGSYLYTQLAQKTSPYGLDRTAPRPIFQGFLMPWLSLQSHEELRVFQLNWHLSLPCAVTEPTRPLVQNIRLQAPGQFGDGKDRVFTASRATSAQMFGPIASAPSQSCSKRALKPVQTFFLKWTQSFLNPDSASISSLWTTHLRNMCRNITNKTKKGQKGKC